MKEPHPAAFTCNLYPAWCCFIISLNEAAVVIDKQIERRLKAARPYSCCSVILMHRAIRKKVSRVIFVWTFLSAEGCKVSPCTYWICSQVIQPVSGRLWEPPVLSKVTACVCISWTYRIWTVLYSTCDCCASASIQGPECKNWLAL